MKTWKCLFAVMLVLAVTAFILPAYADGAGEVVVKDCGNTPPCPVSCEGCGCCGEQERTLGDLFLVGMAVAGLAVMHMCRK